MSRSILLAGPHFARQAGGLERALADLVVRVCTTWASPSTMRPLRPSCRRRRGLEPVPSGARLSKLNRSHRGRLVVGAPVAATAAGAARCLCSARRTRACGRACSTISTAALARAATTPFFIASRKRRPEGWRSPSARHRCVIPVAIEGLAAELAGGAVVGRAPACARGASLAWSARRCARDPLRDPVEPAWAAATVRAGLARPALSIPSTSAFRVPPRLRPPRPFGGRLLYVGRLVKEKGVHVLLAAVARARWRDPRLTLDADRRRRPTARIARSCARRIAALGLEEAVDWRAPVPRSALPRLFTEHDALLFWSPVAEPAPLVAMEAMAARLPVVVPAPRSRSPIHEDGVTCVAYDARDPAALPRRSRASPAIRRSRRCHRRGRRRPDPRWLHAGAHGARATPSCSRRRSTTRVGVKSRAPCRSVRARRSPRSPRSD